MDDEGMAIILAIGIFYTFHLIINARNEGRKVLKNLEIFMRPLNIFCLISTFFRASKIAQENFQQIFTNSSQFFFIPKQLLNIDYFLNDFISFFSLTIVKK